jgi:hypothetical protein
MPWIYFLGLFLVDKDLRSHVFELNNYSSEDGHSHSVV